MLKKNIELDDIEDGLKHVSDMASEIYTELSERGITDIAKKAERLAYMSWMITKMECSNDNDRKESIVSSINCV